MVRRTFVTMAFLLCLAGVDRVQGSQEETDLASLAERVRTGDPERRAAAVERLGASGPPAIRVVTDLLAEEDLAVVDAAETALRRIVHVAASPGSGEQRSRVIEALSSVLEAARTAQQRSVLLEALGLVGGAETVPLVEKALRDPAAREAACRVFARIRVPEAAESIRRVLAEVEDLKESERIALVNALGAQEDLGSAQLLSELASDDDSDEVRLAALEALARNPLSYAYAHVFWGELPTSGDAAYERRRRRVWDALLRIGRSFIEVGEVGAASDLYRDLLAAAESASERCGALVGLGHASRREAPDLIFGALDDSDPQVRAVARDALGNMLWGGLAPRIPPLLKQPDPQLRADVLRALGRRTEPEASVLIASALGDSDAAVRRAALQAIEENPSLQAAEALVKAITSGGAVSGEGAVGVLARMEGEAVGKAIKTALRGAEPPARTLLLKALAKRDDP